MKKQPYVTEQTRKKLIDSFWKIYKNDDISKITVGKICKKAKYDRTTFYRYFFDLDDLINQLEDEIIVSIEEDIKNSQKRTTGILTKGFKSFSKKYGEYITVFYEKGNKSFWNKFKTLIKNKVLSYLNYNIQDDNKKEFLYEFLFSSLINSYAYWYKHKDNMSLEEFVEYINIIILNGTSSFLKKNSE